MLSEIAKLNVFLLKVCIFIHLNDPLLSFFFRRWGEGGVHLMAEQNTPRPRQRGCQNVRLLSGFLEWIKSKCCFVYLSEKEINEQPEWGADVRGFSGGM